MFIRLIRQLFTSPTAVGTTSSRRASPDAQHIAAKRPPVSNLPGIDDSTSYWPASLAHLGQSCDRGGDYVTLAEISETDVNGFEGYRSAALALVPHNMVVDVLESTAVTDHEVQSHGPRPIVYDDGPAHQSGFWIGGIEREDKFEPLVNAWRGGDTHVVVPDNNLLMVFGLVPRHTGTDQIVWDDPHGPVYDVVRTASVSDHQLPKEERQRILVEIRRDYLLEYCRIKQAAAVCFYYEQRQSRGDKAFDMVMAGRFHEDFHLPGRLLNLLVDQYDKCNEPRQIAQVWGRQMTVPAGRRGIIEVDDPALIWPDHAEPMTRELASRSFVMAYVKDQVLCDYEGRPAFEIHPETGGLSYRSQWSVSFCRRIGRDYIALELKKLYEGAPPAVVEHWHRFAVPKAQAEAGVAAHGDMNIAVRAEQIIRAYLSMTRALCSLSERLDLAFTQADIGGYDSAKVDYQGWWTIKGLASLGKVVPLSISRDGFLDRTVDLVVLWESLQQAPLRLIVLKLGIDKKAIAEFKTTKLLATLCQLATMSKTAGHRWPADVGHVIGEWHKDIRLPALRRLFAVNQLRQKASHRTGMNIESEISKDLQVFGIEAGAQAAGWGQAVDSVYDGLIEDINSIAALLNE